MNKLSNCKKICLDVLATFLGAGITEIPSINAFGYLVMMPGAYIFILGFDGLLNKLNKRGNHV